MEQIFESADIGFVKVNAELIPDYLTMVNDRENVGRFIGEPHAPYTEEQELHWVRCKLEENAPVFSMIEKKTGGFIGNVELMNVQNGEAELGIALTASMQDQGYGTQAITALTAYGFAHMELQRITLRAFLFNARAIHVYKKCGFREYRRTDNDVFMELFPPSANA